MLLIGVGLARLHGQADTTDDCGESQCILKLHHNQDFWVVDHYRQVVYQSVMFVFIGSHTEAYLNKF